MIHGNVQIEVFFDDWREVDGIMFPFLVTHELNDEVIEERRNFVDINLKLPTESFTIPANTQNISEEAEKDSSRGWLESQWYLRMQT
jgi:hypothetical protein